MSLSIESIKGESGRCQIELKGRLDTHTSPQLEAALAGLDGKEYPLQILDLKSLDYISSAGLRCIFKARKVAVAAGAEFLLVNLQPPVQKVVDIIKALPPHEIFAKTIDLEEYLHRNQKQTLA